MFHTCFLLRKILQFCNAYLKSKLMSMILYDTIHYTILYHTIPYHAILCHAFCPARPFLLDGPWDWSVIPCNWDDIGLFFTILPHEAANSVSRQDAVSHILESIESGVIPEKEGSAMIKRRADWRGTTSLTWFCMEKTMGLWRNLICEIHTSWDILLYIYFRLL